MTRRHHHKGERGTNGYEALRDGKRRHKSNSWGVRYALAFLANAHTHARKSHGKPKEFSLRWPVNPDQTGVRQQSTGRPGS